MAPTPPILTIRALRSIAVDVPMTYALGTSQARITRAPLLLVDLETEEGLTGRTYLFCYGPDAAPAIARMVEAVGGLVKGQHSCRRSCGRRSPSDSF
jgi:mandelate racemase